MMRHGMCVCANVNSNTAYYTTCRRVSLLSYDKGYGSVLECLT